MWGEYRLMYSKLHDESRVLRPGTIQNNSIIYDLDHNEVERITLLSCDVAEIRAYPWHDKVCFGRTGEFVIFENEYGAKPCQEVMAVLGGLTLEQRARVLQAYHEYSMKRGLGKRPGPGMAMTFC